MYGLLNLRVEVLNSNAQPIETQRPQHLKMFDTCDTRIDFN
jgi:hypothetical protein